LNELDPKAPVNLVLVFIPGAVDPEDFVKIAANVRTIAPNIDVYVLQDKVPDSKLFERLLARRTFVFAPHQLTALAVGRGRVHAGRPMLKSEQLLRLELAGVPVPKWTMLDRGKRFDPAVWGEYVVLKPEVSSGARGVTIARTRALNEQAARVATYARGEQGIVVQQLIKNATFGKARIQTLFDAVLFARRFRLQTPVKFETEADLAAYQQTFATENTRAEDYDDARVLDLARRCAAAFDDVPMLALDVLFDESDAPYFIEANPGGNTWHFSSTPTGQMLRARGTFLERQFGAFEVAAKVLARKALEEAV